MSKINWDEIPTDAIYSMASLTEVPLNIPWVKIMKRRDFVLEDWKPLMARESVLKLEYIALLKKEFQEKFARHISPHYRQQEEDAYVEGQMARAGMAIVQASPFGNPTGRL